MFAHNRLLKSLLNGESVGIAHFPLSSSDIELAHLGTSKLSHHGLK